MQRLRSACSAAGIAILLAMAPVSVPTMGAVDARSSILQPEPGHAPKPAARKGGLPEGVKVVRNIAYAQVNGKPLLLDLYLPEDPATPPPPGAPQESPRPVVIWVHGGGWETGSKEQCPASALVAHGYAAVSINYRLSNVAAFPAQIHDCKGAVRWVRANATKYNFDADHIGAWGASAGGHLVALMGTSSGESALEDDVGGNLDQSSKVQAVCDWFGPTDLVKLCRLAMTLGADDGTSTAKPQPKRLKTPDLFRKLFGGELDDRLDTAKLANPIPLVDKTDPPFLIMHGDKDPLVPLAQSQELETALTKVGVPVKLEVVKDAGHGFWSQDILKTVISFFDERLKPSKQASSTPEKTDASPPAGGK